MPTLPKHDPLAVPATNDEINRWREYQERRPITVLGYCFDADPVSLSRLELAMKAHHWGIGSRLMWKMADNATVALEKDQCAMLWEALQRELYLRQGGLFSLAQEFKQSGITLRELKDWKP